MYIEQTIKEPNLKPCPFCNDTVLFITRVSYENGEDEGYRPLCKCGWAWRSIRKWYSNKAQLIQDYNTLIVENGDEFIL